MTRHLLDVNVVIALIDPLHVHHERAHAWFATRDAPWCTSPTVQNGVVRVVSHPKYPNTQPAPTVIASLASLAAQPDHEFLPDSVSLLDASVHTERLLASSQVTDTYLLHLAASYEARLATFDTRIVTAAVPSGAEVVFAIP
ncbi:TA system VapC family ribonuclease toxin [Microbacterium aurantiacum]|uniref:Ribonuclease VapC n=2 Tax=Microbacterium aurantiacum TaxID=162393 RepID=A0A0M8MGQ1_9MICO|nr:MULTISPECIES: TA system VapC family ribonuclease toxin [Microbacterium]ANG84777.1 DNA-binding protein [Microbacterium chocolatum]KOS12116.1 DNA-binding protein [Microbacterium chocolatum]MDS0244652.1 VapC toxin family PIN domain ribonuclease [Microbacterium aurantiacum]